MNAYAKKVKQYYYAYIILSDQNNLKKLFQISKAYLASLL